jgi:hypothetical protein
MPWRWPRAASSSRRSGRSPPTPASRASC